MPGSAASCLALASPLMACACACTFSLQALYGARPAPVATCGRAASVLSHCCSHLASYLPTLLQAGVQCRRAPLLHAVLCGASGPRHFPVPGRLLNRRAAGGAERRRAVRRVSGGGCAEWLLCALLVCGPLEKTREAARCPHTTPQPNPTQPSQTHPVPHTHHKHAGVLAPLKPLLHALEFGAHLGAHEVVDGDAVHIYSQVRRTRCTLHGAGQQFTWGAPSVDSDALPSTARPGRH